jgi:protein-S-isoprenylcysteine O-methyltransferase Ste14
MRLLRAFGSTVFTLVIYLGLPLLGWGLDDLPAFFALPPRFGYALIVLIMAGFAGTLFYRSPEKLRGGRGRSSQRIGRQTFVAIVMTGMLFFGLAFVAYSDRQQIWTFQATPLLRWIGLVLFVLGIGLVFWSGIALGRMYSAEVTLQDEHRLITDGLYRRIRHPRYLGGILFGVGLSWLYQSGIGVICTIVFFFVVLFRIRDEEMLMLRAFGKEWECYSEHSWRLIPWIY